MGNSFKNKNIKAFTLVEIIVYMALFAMVFILIIEFTISIKQINSSTNNSTRIDNSALFANQALESTLSTMETVVAGSSAFDSDNGVLNVILKSGQVIEFKIEAGKLKITRGGVSNFITPDGVIVTRFRITPIYTADISLTNVIGVKMELAMYVQNNSEPRKDRSITNSFYILGD